MHISRHLQLIEDSGILCLKGKRSSVLKLEVHVPAVNIGTTAVWVTGFTRRRRLAFKAPLFKYCRNYSTARRGLFSPLNSVHKCVRSSEIRTRSAAPARATSGHSEPDHAKPEQGLHRYRLWSCEICALLRYYAASSCK